MPTITRENIRIRLRHRGAEDSGFTFKFHTGTLTWDSEAHTLTLVEETGNVLQLTDESEDLGPGTVLLKDAPLPTRIEGVYPEADGALESLRILGVIEDHSWHAFGGRQCTATLAADLGAAAQEASTRTASVTLFKPSGKYSAQYEWRVPVGGFLPEHMELSPDFTCMDGGTVLVDADAASELPGARNWGYPTLIFP